MILMSTLKRSTSFPIFENNDERAIKTSLSARINYLWAECQKMYRLLLNLFNVFQCVTHTLDRTPLPLAHAFRRFFQLVSSGFLLHTSVAVADPCNQKRRINYGFELDEAVRFFVVFNFK